MIDPVDAVGLLAVNSGQVLLVRRPGETDWRIPRAGLAAPTEDAAEIARAENALAAEHGLQVLDRSELGPRSVGGVTYSLARVRIAARPEVAGLETRLVRLAQLPKELASPDRELLDALLQP
jgi:hypothetical protein